MGSSKAVLVTGAAGGIGSALTRALAERGYTVYAGRRSTTRRQQGAGDIRTLTFDVADEHAVAAAAEIVRQEQGAEGLRAVVNNAGVIVQGPLELLPAGEVRRQFDANVLGPAIVTRAFLPLLRTGGGRVINVSAPTARIPFPYLGALSASKAALESMSDAARIELRPWNIPVVVVQPGALETEIFTKAQSAADKSLASSDPLATALYEPALDAVRRATEKQKLAPLDSVVRTLITAIETRRPKRLYLSGAAARQAAILSHLPKRLRDRLLISALGLGRAEAGH